MWSHILNFFWINGWSYKTTIFTVGNCSLSQISYASLKKWSWKICSYHNIFYIFSKAVILVPILKGFWPKLLKNGSQSISSNRMKVSFFPFIVLCRENSWEVHNVDSTTLQMFAGIYGGFTGKSGCRDFKFTGIACYLLSLQSFLSKNDNKCREFDLQGYYRDSLHKL